jgi:hypothetical protein
MRKKRDDIHETPDVTYIHNPEVSHEASDVNVKAIIQFTAGLLVAMVLTVVLMKLMYNVFEKREQKQELKTPAGPMALSNEERLPPEDKARLQAAPGFGVTLKDGKRVNLELQAPQAEYRVLKKEWDRELKDGIMDTKTGAVTALPIEQAMKQVVQQGLPSRQAADGQKTYEQTMQMPSYQSSGRMMEMRKQ